MSYFEHISHLVLISIVNLEQVNVGWGKINEINILNKHYERRWNESSGPNSFSIYNSESPTIQILKIELV